MPPLGAETMQRIPRVRQGNNRSRRAALGLSAVALIVVTATGLTASGATGTTAPTNCSTATATRLVNRYDLNSFLLDQPVAQALCGPFTGAGSDAMAVGIAAPTCWPVQAWAVFRHTSGGWQLVLDRSEWVVPPLVAVGSRIRVTSPVFRSTDSTRCNPTGGTRSRVWHWNG